MTDLPTYPLPRDPQRPLDPPPRYRELPRVARVRIWDGSTPWLITRYEDVKAALRDDRLSADATAPGYPHISAASARRGDRVLPYSLRPDADHRAQRQLLAPEFNPRRTAALLPAIERTVDAALDEFLAGPQPADLMADFALPVAVTVVCDLLGAGHHDRVRLHTLSRTIGSRTATPEQAGSAMAEMERYFQDLVVAEPAHGLAGRIVRHVRAGRLQAADAAAMLQLVFFAGHGPTAYMIGSGVAALLRSPARLALADSDSAVEEMLRYISVSHSARQRVATADLVLGGQPIAAGEGVLIQLDAANRDPAVFADPDLVDLSAPPRPHLAFAHGAHICTGRLLARLELRAVFGRLARRVPTLRLAVPFEQLRFTEYENILGVERLPVRW